MPPTPFARVPVYVLIGAIKDKPAVVDGLQGGILATVMRDVLENPWQLVEGGKPAQSSE